MVSLQYKKNTKKRKRKTKKRKRKTKTRKKQREKSKRKKRVMVKSSPKKGGSRKQSLIEGHHEFM